jgi:hypothetical protein
VVAEQDFQLLVANLDSVSFLSLLRI